MPQYDDDHPATRDEINAAFLLVWQAGRPDLRAGILELVTRARDAGANVVTVPVIGLEWLLGLCDEPERY